MNYAIIEDGVVVNVIVGLPEGMDGVPLGDRSVGIGDAYADGAFWRDGVRVLSIAEQLAAAQAALDEIAEALNE